MLIKGVELVKISAGEFIYGVTHRTDFCETWHYAILFGVVIMLAILCVLRQVLKTGRRFSYSLRFLLGISLVIGVLFTLNYEWELAQNHNEEILKSNQQLIVLSASFNNYNIGKLKKIDREFYMSKYEITQKQFFEIMGYNPSKDKGDDFPVTNVSWEESCQFCKKFSDLTSVECRLPQVVEFEFAAISGSQEFFATGSGIGNLEESGWYNGNSGSKLHKVGIKTPNKFGLYDMNGNVWE